MKVFKLLKLFYIRFFVNSENKIKSLFDHHFFSNHYYLHKSASDVHMAKILNIDIPSLNKISYENYHLEFNDLCEKYRVEHFWDECTNPLNADLPVNSLINASGFKSNEEFSSLITNKKEETKKKITDLFL